MGDERKNRLIESVYGSKGCKGLNEYRWWERNDFFVEFEKDGLSWQCPLINLILKSTLVVSLVPLKLVVQTIWRLEKRMKNETLLILTEFITSG